MHSNKDSPYEPRSTNQNFSNRGYTYSIRSYTTPSAQSTYRYFSRFASHQIDSFLHVLLIQNLTERRPHITLPLLLQKIERVLEMRQIEKRRLEIGLHGAILTVPVKPLPPLPLTGVPIHRPHRCFPPLIPTEIQTAITMAITTPCLLLTPLTNTDGKLMTPRRLLRFPPVLEIGEQLWRMRCPHVEPSRCRTRLLPLLSIDIIGTGTLLVTTMLP